jgi:hypothetical protein
VKFITWNTIKNLSLRPKLDHLMSLTMNMSHTNQKIFSRLNLFKKLKNKTLQESKSTRLFQRMIKLILKIAKTSRLNQFSSFIICNTMTVKRKKKLYQHRINYMKLKKTSMS